MLADIQFLNNYTNTTLRHETKYTEMMQNDVVQPVLATNAVNTPQNYCEGLQLPVSVFEYTLPFTINVFNSYSTMNLINSNSTPIPISSSFSPTQVLTASINNTIGPCYNRKFPLNIIKNSIFSVDKDMFFGEEYLYLKIIWDSPTKVYYTAQGFYDGTDPPSSETIAFGSSYTINNLYLYAASEKNPMIINKLKNETMSNEGKKILVPFVYTRVISTSINQALELRYNRAHGRKLLKVIWAPFQAPESGNQAYNHNNQTQIYAGANTKFVNSFYTTINSLRTNRFDYNCLNGDDYMIKSKRLKGTCINGSLDYYLYWSWREEFDNNYAAFEKVPASFPEDNFVDGLDLTEQQVYTIYPNFESGVSFNNYFFSITLKELTVSRGGIQFV